MSSYDPFRQGRRPNIDLGQWFQQQGKQFLPVVGVVLVLATALSSYYQVEPEEIGVVMRFGKHVENTEPGPHFKIPFGVDQVIKVPVRRQLKMEFGFRSQQSRSGGAISKRDHQTRAEAVMLTGDLNVGTVEWIVQYVISSPEKYLFNFRDVQQTIRLMSEATMRTVVGDHSVDELITGGRERIEGEAKELLSTLCRQYDIGITVQQLKLQDANVPETVKPALREVEEAKQERERVINEAWANYNKVIPRAKGKALQAIEEAEGYALEVVNRSKGDAERFKALYQAYKKAPNITKTRLYLDAMTEVLPKAKRKVVVDADTKNLVPLLNLTPRSGS